MFDSLVKVLEDLQHTYARPLQTFAVLLWMSIMPLAAVWQLTSYFFPLYWLWMQFDTTPRKGGFRLASMQNLVVWKWFADYFPVTIKSSAKLDPQKNYLVIAHPHSILPLSVFSNFATTRTDTPKLFPGMTFHVCTLASNFVTAGLREILMSLGCRPVSEESIRYALTHGRGQCVVDVVGGSSEALDQEPHTYELTLLKRRGYLRIALEEGVDLVPCFSFGENNTFHQKDNSRGTMLRRVQEALKKGIGMSPTLFWGRSVTGDEWGFLPLRRRITTVVGPPVKVKKSFGKATEQDIDELRGRYVQALKKLFDEHADEYAPGRKENLKIVA